ncbi:MAG TPA: hypothetical protein VKA63_05415 [Candidatus Krumholzibacteria bacterium]|nr:hypothetical protein [Candidatus Krumholzibacteria bacterium]
MSEQTRAKLAEYAHDAWSGWMKYLFAKSEHNSDGTVTIPKWAVDRWRRQSETEYADLPKGEQRSDLDEADAILGVLDHEAAADLAAMEKCAETLRYLFEQFDKETIIRNTDRDGEESWVPWSIEFVSKLQAGSAALARLDALRGEEE